MNTKTAVLQGKVSYPGEDYLLQRRVQILIKPCAFAEALFWMRYIQTNPGLFDQYSVACRSIPLVLNAPPKSVLGDAL
jgi:hypothetical protein